MEAHAFSKGEGDSRFEEQAQDEGWGFIYLGFEWWARLEGLGLGTKPTSWSSWTLEQSTQLQGLYGQMEEGQENL